MILWEAEEGYGISYVSLKIKQSSLGQAYQLRTTPNTRDKIVQRHTVPGQYIRCTLLFSDLLTSEDQGSKSTEILLVRLMDCCLQTISNEKKCISMYDLQSNALSEGSLALRLSVMVGTLPSPFLVVWYSVGYHFRWGFMVLPFYSNLFPSGHYLI